MRRRGFIVVTAVLLVASCSSTDQAADDPGVCSMGDGDRAGTGEPTPTEELRRWAGFDDVAELEVIGADEDCGRDVLVRIALRGDPASVDTALEAADFTSPSTPGMSVFQSPLDGVDPDDLTGVVSSDQQSWENPSGHELVRAYVRGTQSDGQDVLHVWAFTT